MDRLTSPVDHGRLARRVIKKVVVEPAVELVEKRSGYAMSPEQQAAAAERSSWSDAVSADLQIAFALGVALFLLFVAPLAAGYVANGRLSGVWWLRSTGLRQSRSAVEEVDLGKKQDKGVHHDDEKNTKFSSVALTLPPPRPLRIAPVSSLAAHLRTLYNQFLLPTSPFFSLTYGQLLISLVYIAIFVFCLFYKATDQKTDWKRSGAVSVAGLPALFVLATKNNVLSMLGKGYEKLNYLHRIGGRLVIFCGLLHSLLFLIQNKVNWQKPVHVSGVVCTIACLLILIPSISYFRRAFYQVFLISHIAGWISFIVALQYHVPEFARPYTVFCLAIYGVDILLRLLKTRFGHASIVALPSGATLFQSHTLNSGWRPGQHVWVRVWKGAKGWETHPLTVANAPRGSSPLLEGSHNLTLVAKNVGGWTGALHKHASVGESAFQQGAVVRVAIEGPYGGPMFTDFADCQSAIFFAGGSGITFAASSIEELVSLAVKGRLRTRTVTLVWSFKALETVEWYQAFLTSLVEVAREKTSLNLRVLLYVTQPSSSSTPLISPIPFTALRPGRPSSSAILTTVVEEVASSVKRKCLPRGGGIVVGTCGPRKMVDEVRKAVSRVEREKAVLVGGIVSYSETFGF
ncbi:hypothetical protein JCM8547_006130 [Rhodosporidiobolus lusitaniae]